MRTSAKIAHIEAETRAAFSVAEARAAVATIRIPEPGHTPAQKIASALKVDAIQSAAPDAVARIKDGLTAAVAKAEAGIAAIADDAALGYALAAYIVAKSNDLPEAAPDHLRAAAMALRGAPGAAVVARQLQLASDVADGEANRLRERWLPRTAGAAVVAAHRKAEAVFRAAGLERKAEAHRLMGERKSQQMRAKALNDSKRRLGQ